MKQHNIQPANYINWIGRTVLQVHEEAALHQSLSSYLPELVKEIGREDTRAIRQKLLSYVENEKHEGRLKLTPPEPTPIGWKIRNFWHLISIPLVLLILSPLFLITAPFLIWRLRMLERTDPDIVLDPNVNR